MKCDSQVHVMIFFYLLIAVHVGSSTKCEFMELQQLAFDTIRWTISILGRYLGQTQQLDRLEVFRHVLTEGLRISSA